MNDSPIIFTHDRSHTQLEALKFEYYLGAQLEPTIVCVDRFLFVHVPGEKVVEGLTSVTRLPLLIADLRRVVEVGELFQVGNAVPRPFALLAQSENGEFPPTYAQVVRSYKRLLPALQTFAQALPTPRALVL